MLLILGSGVLPLAISSFGVTKRTLRGRAKIRCASALGTPLPASVSMVFFSRARYSSKNCLARALNGASSGIENRQIKRAASSSSIRAAKTEMTAAPG